MDLSHAKRPWTRVLFSEKWYLLINLLCPSMVYYYVNGMIKIRILSGNREEKRKIIESFNGPLKLNLLFIHY